jgi:hypothetical protein
MPNLILKNQISGYYFVNSTKNDKQMYIYFRFSDTESYILNFIFPKNKITYVFFYRNTDDKLWISAKSANNLKDAMDQEKIASREAIQIIVITDLDKKSINFITKDKYDKLFPTNLFDKNDILTSEENELEKIIRQSIIGENAGTKLTGWFVDEETIFSFVDSEIRKLVEVSTKLRTYLSEHSLGSGMRNIQGPLTSHLLSTISTVIQSTTKGIKIAIPFRS